MIYCNLYHGKVSIYSTKWQTEKPAKTFHRDRNWELNYVKQGKKELRI